MKKNVTVGSDPEFVIVDSNNNMVPAYTIFDPLRSKYCTSTNKMHDCNSRCTLPNIYCGHGMSPEIGQDCGAGELRPRAADNPLQHRDNIQDLFKQMEIPDGYKLYAGTRQNRMSLGGHIHIGFRDVDVKPFNVMESLIFIDQNKGLANYLSYYCGIPLKKIERKSDLKIRGLRPYRYGFYGGFDNKSYGVEWRMPSSFLLSIPITTAALCLSYVCAQEYLKNPRYMALSVNAYLKLVQGDVSHIIQAVEKMDYYRMYHSEIEPLFQMINNNKKWNTKQNLLEEWL